MFIEFMIDNPKLVQFALAYVGIGISLVVAGPFRSEISVALRHAQPGRSSELSLAEDRLLG